MEVTGAFVADTTVRTDKGLKMINDVQVGDNVLTSDGYHTVTKVFAAGKRDVYMYEIHTDKRVVHVRCTNDHFVKQGDDFKRICDIRRGDRVWVFNDSIQCAKILEITNMYEGQEDVYNIEVEGIPEYVANRLLVQS